MDLFSLVTDVKLENQGTWVTYGDASFLVARSGNKRYNRRMSDAYKANRVVLELEDDSSDAMSEQIFSDVIANTILLDWKGVSWKGAPLDYSVENAKMVLLASRDFRNIIARMADDIENYRVKVEVEQGNA
jgi:hypothetical protein